ncbi:MAG: hypothetical protein ABEJ61_01665 [Haloferacaceae archaeon]
MSRSSGATGDEASADRSGGARGDGAASADAPATRDDEASTGARVADEGRDDHLEDVPDGAGCTEIWAHLSEGRADDS